MARGVSAKEFSYEPAHDQAAAPSVTLEKHQNLL